MVYTGSGIYRHTWLITTSPVYVTQWGTVVTTPKVSSREATVNVITTIANDTKETGKLKIVSSIIDNSGKEGCLSNPIGKWQAPATKINLKSALKVLAPKLWDVSHPNLYKLVTSIYNGKLLQENYTTPFGIRTISFRADSGFFLNGKNLKILGVCNHHDLGSLGAALNDRALQRQLELLKSMGVQRHPVAGHNLMGSRTSGTL